MTWRVRSGRVGLGAHIEDSRACVMAHSLLKPKASSRRAYPRSQNRLSHTPSSLHPQ